MKYYNKYMDRQVPSPALHQRLVELGEHMPVASPKSMPGGRNWKRGLAAVCACAIVAVGIGVWQLSPGQGEQVPNDAVYPGVKDNFGPGETPPPDGYFFIQGQGGEKLMFPNVPYVDYSQPDVAGDASASIALPEGSFDRALTGDELANIFWGPEAKPQAGNSKQEQGELPWVLGWADYTLTGRATYDGAGSLLWLYVFGQHPCGAEFTLQLSPGRLPPSCAVDSGRKTSLVNGVNVVGSSRTYDRNVDGVADTICTSEFMVGEVGVRFESVNSPFQSGNREQASLNAGEAQQFNALFVGWATPDDGALYLDHLLTTDDIPLWRSEEFSTLAQAREETAFAPYLPQKGPSGYGEVYGRLSYQQGMNHNLWVRWSRGHDDVEVYVALPEGEQIYNTVDVSNPASYDTRLYQIPWADSVPEEYRENFYSPVFRAQDMSLEVVRARGVEKDTGGTSYRFEVLFSNGTVVQYSCDELNAQQVWDMVEQTLTMEQS